MWFDAEIVGHLRLIRERAILGTLNEDGPRVPVWKVLRECEDAMEVYSQLDDPELRRSGKLGRGSVVCSVCRRYSGYNPCNACFRDLSENWPVDCVVCMDQKGTCSCSNRI